LLGSSLGRPLSRAVRRISVFHLLHQDYDMNRLLLTASALMNRVLLTASALMMFVFAGVAQDKKDERKGTVFFPLQKGVKWVYVSKSAGNELEVSSEITDVKEAKKAGGRPVITVSSMIGARKVWEEQYSSNETGYYQHTFSGQKLETPILAVKYPLKEGMKWSEKGKIQGAEFTVDFECKKKEEVTVAAGKFKAFPVEVVIKSGGETSRITNWYAEGVGAVKVQTDVDGRIITQELKHFTPVAK